jgi:allantoinase
MHVVSLIANCGFSTGQQLFTYMRDAFDVLHRDGRNGSPKLFSIGLHDRLIGRPGRSAGLMKLLDYMRGFDDVWFCTGADNARHWRDNFPAVPISQTQAAIGNKNFDS